MSDFDERLRRVVRTIGETAPHPPAMPEARLSPRRPWSGPLIALGAFATVVLVVGTALVIVWPGSSDDPAGVASVRHQILDVTVTADLTCAGAVGAGTSTVRIETWADFETGRFRQLIRFEDGSTRDRIVLGDLHYPTAAYAKSGSALMLPACDGDVLLGDPTAGPGVLFFNLPYETANVPGYEELGTLVPGSFTDSLGRSSVLYRQTIDGYSMDADGTEIPLRQVTEWHVDPETGDVLQRTFAQTQVGRFDVGQAVVVTVDDTTDIDSATLSEDGYELEWTADDEHGPTVEAIPIEPHLTLGTTAIWPVHLESGGAVALAERFAREVLQWPNATLGPLDGAEPAAPTWATLNDPTGHETTILVSPFGNDGWGILQIGDPTGIGAGPLGTATIPNGAPDAASATIHASDTTGLTYAWEADLTAAPAHIALPGIEPWTVQSLLVTYHDEAGRITDAAGGSFGG